MTIVIVIVVVVVVIGIDIVIVIVTVIFIDRIDRIVDRAIPRRSVYLHFIFFLVD